MVRCTKSRGMVARDSRLPIPARDFRMTGISMMLEIEHRDQQVRQVAANAHPFVGALVVVRVVEVE